MSGFVYRIVWKPDPDRPNRRFANLETSHPTLEALVDALNSGMVFGRILHTRKTDEAGVLEVFERRDVAIRIDEVREITIPTVRFVEFEGDAP